MTSQWTPEEHAAATICGDIYLLSRRIYAAAQNTNDINILTFTRESMIVAIASMQSDTAAEVRQQLDAAGVDYGFGLA